MPNGLTVTCKRDCERRSATFSAKHEPMDRMLSPYPTLKSDLPTGNVRRNCESAFVAII